MDGEPITEAWFGAMGDEPRRVVLPHVFDARITPRGTYRLDLRPALAGVSARERLRVRFHACAVKARFSLDGQDIGSQVGDWVPFEVAVPAGYSGSGDLSVEVDADPEHATRGFLPTCGLIHGGLWQGAEILKSGPTWIDRDRVVVRARDGVVRVEVPTLGAPGKRCWVGIVDGGSGEVVAEVATTDGVAEVEVPGLATWSPWRPERHVAQFIAEDADGGASDRHALRFGMRTVATEDDRLVMNGIPVQLRGVLHWGYYPELGAPLPPEARLAKELARYRVMGFNAVKCCLWVPPRSFLDACEKAGLMVWQEYPVWLKPLSGDDLVEEYDAWFRHDRNHACVTLRTLTCENDSMDAATIAAVRERASSVLPGELILDNSAWLQIAGSGAFHDEHPYLHNAQWDAYLDRTRRALDERERRPLMLGETCAVDALPSRRDLELDGAPGTPDYKDAYEAVLRAWGGEPDGLRARALRCGDQIRRHQIERLRLKLPGAGYVLNSARDIPACPIGFADARGRMKTRLEGFAGQGDSVVIADLRRRSFSPDERIHVPVAVSHFGDEPLEMADATWKFGLTRRGRLPDTTFRPGTLTELTTLEFTAPKTGSPRRDALEIAGARGSWNLWTVPDEPMPDGVLVTDSLDEARPHLNDGGAVLLHAHVPVSGGWRCPENVFWSFIPHLIDDLECADMISDLLPFDLLSGRVLAWDGRQGRPVIELLDLHSRPGNALRHPLVLEGTVGTGRLMISALDPTTPAGRHVHATLARRCVDGSIADDPRIDLPAPVRTVMLDGPWRSVGSDTFIVTGTPAVNAGANVFEGWRSFEGTVTIPEPWPGRVLLRTEAVGDAWRLHIDGHRVLAAGEEEGVLDGQRDTPRTFDLSKRLTPGRTHQLRWDIRDWRGAGGLVGPVYLTNSDPEARLIY